MRLSNRKKAPLFRFYFTFINVISIMCLIVYILDISLISFMGNWKFFLIIIPTLLYFIFYIKGKQIFEYDSDGEAVMFINKSISIIFNKETKDEFPKYKLHSFEFFNALFFKRLFIKVNSKTEKVILLKYDISYLTKREIRDLKISLKKIVCNNNNKENIGYDKPKKRN
ncbi:hypothetical protein SAMN05421544_102180 [Riemerella columbipharyngis]|uniref:Uncharacterized protein n=1 Tax=Riemerella columbipharyngis TaxID=1071918 RepID=A0A1G6ZQW6_9FLAO|nr:hypothetical protein SAMN05421544_102180 [Riemerella columbipharyngis]